MLEVCDVSKRYGALTAVSHVSFTVRPGEVLGYLGPNGSGKSTTVKMLTGLMPPTTGLIRFDGADIQDDLITHKARVGYVPEEAHVYTYLTGPEYLSLIGGLRGIPLATVQDRIDGFLTLFNLKDDVHAPMSAYSKGMRQKVLISAALLHNPRIIILDEPNSGLDVTTTLLLRSLVQTLAREGRMIVYSSHLLEAIEQVATDVLILHDGQVVAHDSVARLRSLMALPSLEQVFRTLVIETDIDGLANDLVANMKR